MSDAVVFEGVGVVYDETAVLRDVDLVVPEGELVLVTGATGSGKSTLLGAVNGLVPHFTGGTLSGRVLVHGRDTRTHRPRDLAEVVGVVGQDPLAGFVTDTVEEELAYGMEQLGLDPAVMRRRVEETLDLLGIADLRRAPLVELSGGQQQRVALGAVLTAHPRVLVLDEPTSALDPTGAEEVLAALTRLVHDLGVTALVAEHRLERVAQYADVVVVVEGGLVRSGPPAEVLATSPIAPPVVELGRLAGWDPPPLSVREAIRAHRASPLAVPAGPEPRPTPSRQPLLSAAGVVVRHGPLTAVDRVDLELHPGEVAALMGRNGSGKSSLMWALQGSGRRTAGKVAVEGRDPAQLPARERRRLVGLVPQTPGDLLYLDTAGAECARADTESDATAGTCAELVRRLVPGLDLETHPRDLSEGQRLALVLGIQLTADPRVLLLDEPTRGLDYRAKRELARLLRGLADSGTSVLLSTHDVEFTALAADRMLVMAQGEVVTDGPVAEVATSSPAFAPQVAKVLGAPWLSVDQLRGSRVRAR